MFAAVQSELTRLRQPRLLVTWFGLMALFAMMINTIMVTFASGGGSLPPGAPGVAFPTLLSSKAQRASWQAWPQLRTCSAS